MEIGEILKEAREEKDISLDSLQETTKIQKRYLVAIEEGNFHILPGKFYAKAFIKEYAIAIGLDPNELLEDYKEEIPSSEENDSTEYKQIQRSRRRNNPSKSPAIFSLMPTIIVVLLVIGIVFVAVTLYQKTVSNSNSNTGDTKDNNEIIRDTDEDGDHIVSEDEDPTNEIDDKEDGETIDIEAELQIVEKGTESVPESTFDLNNVDSEIKVLLTSKGNTWLEVKTGAGESLYSGEFTENLSPMELDLSNEDRVYFQVGYAPDLQITINGAELEYPIDPNDKAFQKIWVNVNKKEE